jgi:hypothetical protein
LKGLVLLNLKITKINNAKTVLKTVSYNLKTSFNLKKSIMKAVEEGLYWKPPRKRPKLKVRNGINILPITRIISRNIKDSKKSQMGSNCFVAISVYEG